MRKASARTHPRVRGEIDRQRGEDPVTEMGSSRPHSELCTSVAATGGIQQGQELLLARACEWRCVHRVAGLLLVFWVFRRLVTCTMAFTVNYRPRLRVGKVVQRRFLTCSSVRVAADEENGRYLRVSSAHDAQRAHCAIGFRVLQP